MRSVARLYVQVEAVPGREVHRDFLPLKGKNLVIYSFASGEGSDGGASGGGGGESEAALHSSLQWLVD